MSSNAIFPQHFEKLTLSDLPVFLTGKPPVLGRLYTASEFNHVKPYVMEIDITPECAEIKEDSFLEISVPVLGLTDLFNKVDYLSKQVLHSSIVAINGFGAVDEEENGYSFPYFVKVKDLIENQYEIIISRDGHIECPSQGMGLFSVINQITFLFSEKQIKDGEGLKECSAIKKNKLYLLPPTGTDESYTLHICTVHFDHKNRRIVDTWRTVDVHFIKEETSLPPVSYLKTVYSEHDFMRDYLSSKIALSKENDYNNFLLRPEAFGRFYDALVHDLSKGYISMEYLRQSHLML